MLYKKQSGYGSILLLTILGLMAVSGTYYYKTRESASNAIEQKYLSTALEINEISNAVTSYYKDNHSWPTSMNEVITQGYFNGSSSRCGGGAFVSTVCTNIFGVELGDDYTLSVNLLSDSLASMVANQIKGGSSSGTTLTAIVKRPFQSTLYQDYLQRVEDPDNPSRTTLEQAIDFNDNDLLNANEFNAKKVVFDDLESSNLIVNKLDVDTLKIGGNEIESKDSTLEFDTDSITVNGDILLNDDLLGNGDLTNFTKVTAQKGEFDDISAVSANIKELSGRDLSFLSGNVINLSGSELYYDSGTTDTLNGQDIDFGDGVIGNISGVTANYSRGLISRVLGTNLVFSKGSFTSLSGDESTSNKLSSDDFFSNYVNSNVAEFDDLLVKGSFTAPDLIIDDFVTNTLQSDSANIYSGKVINATGGVINISGDSDFDVLVSENIETDKFKTNKGIASSGSVSGEAKIRKVNVKNLIISNELNTEKLKSTTSSLGSASSSKLGISDSLTSSKALGSVLDISTSQFIKLKAVNASFSTVNGNVFTGRDFQTTDDFYTSVSSVNKNFDLITDQQQILDNCMYVTEFCLPQTPKIDISCVNCISSKSSESFSATITAVISQCRQGCSYSWSKTAFNGYCPSGSISAGSSKTVSCTVTGSASAESLKTGSVSITASNSLKSSLSTTKSVSIRWSNTQPAEPVGCFYDANNQVYTEQDESSDYGDNERYDEVTIYTWDGVEVYRHAEGYNDRDGTDGDYSNTSGSLNDGRYSFETGAVISSKSDARGSGGYLYEATFEICRIER